MSTQHNLDLTDPMQVANALQGMAAHVNAANAEAANENADVKTVAVMLQRNGELLGLIAAALSTVFHGQAMVAARQKQKSGIIVPGIRVPGNGGIC